MEPLPPGSPRARAAMGSREPASEGAIENVVEDGTLPAAEGDGSTMIAPSLVASHDSQVSMMAARTLSEETRLGSNSAETATSTGTGTGTGTDTGTGTSTGTGTGTRAGELNAMTRDRTIRVKVGKASLVVRKTESTSSAQIGQVNPGQMVTVLKEVIYPKGKVRAMIDLASITNENGAATKRTITSRKNKKALQSTGAPAPAPLSLIHI